MFPVIIYTLKLITFWWLLCRLCFL